MPELICPECDAANPRSEEICQQCGFPLVGEPAAMVDPDHASQCPGCGKTVTAEMKFCDGCGQSLSGRAPSADDPPPAPLPRADDAASSVADSDADTGTPEPPPLPEPDATSRNRLPDAVGSDSGQWKLSVVEGFSIGKEYLVFKEEMVLGRLDAESDIYPDIDLEDQDDGYVSRKHAVLRMGNGTITVEDLGGENGTTIDRKPLPPFKPQPLAEEQVLRIGKVGLMLKRHVSK